MTFSSAAASGMDRVRSVRFASLWRNGVSPATCSSFVAAASIYLWTLTFWFRFDGGIEGQLAATMGIFGGIACASFLSGVSRRGLARLAAGFAIGQPVICDFVASLVSLGSISAWETAAARAGLVVAAGTLAFVPGVAFAVGQMTGRRIERAVGAAAGLAAACLFLRIAPLWLAIGCSVCAYLAQSLWTDGFVCRRSRPRRAPFGGVASELGVVVAAGLVCGVGIRFTTQWFLLTPSVVAAIGLSVAISLAWRCRWSAAAVTAAGSAVLLAGYPGWSLAAAKLTATFSSPVMLVPARTLIVLAVLVPPFVGLTATLRRGRVAGRSLLGAAGVSVGLAAAAPPVICLLVAILIVCGASVPIRSRRRTIATSIALGSVVVAAAAGAYRPESLARVVHAPSTIAMLKQGQGVRDAIATDESRLVAVEESPAGVLTAWSMRGLQASVYSNGASLGTLTHRPELCPRLGPDVLTATLPIVLHGSPEKIVFLGSGNGESILTTTDFGVPLIEVIDRRERLEFLRRHSGPRAASWEDPRLREHHMPPRFATLGSSLDADVLVVDDEHLGTLTRSGPNDLASVKHVKRHLQQGGIACHRVRLAGLGVDGLLQLVAGYRDVFRQVAAMEIGPGQWAVLASDQTTPLVTLAAVERLRRDDVRLVLGEVGWDWSLVAKLYMLDGEKLADCIDAAGVEAASGWNAEFARLAESRSLSGTEGLLAGYRQHISPYVSTALVQIDDAQVVREIEARLADAKERDRLLADTPDEFWSYRSALKSRLKTRPRAAIQQVSHTSGLKPQLHPEDQRRKEYLATLGTAIAEADGSRLRQFVAPYDPLVSVFVHGEAARIHGEAEEHALALDHLVASVFKTHNDVSVQAATLALDLVSSGLGGSDEARYDLAQGLLEQLRRRWHARIASDNPNWTRSNSIRDTVEACRGAIRVLDEIVASNRELAAHWEGRRPVVHRDLIERLRMHQQASQARALKFEQQRAYLKSQRAAKQEDL